MTGPEHILTWIESSAEHYRRLLTIARADQELRTFRALQCLTLANDAYRAMIRCGDAYASDHSAATILGAAALIEAWKAPE